MHSTAPRTDPSLATNAPFTPPMNVVEQRDVWAHTILPTTQRKRAAFRGTMDGRRCLSCLPSLSISCLHSSPYSDVSAFALHRASHLQRNFPTEVPLDLTPSPSKSQLPTLILLGSKLPKLTRPIQVDVNRA